MRAAAPILKGYFKMQKSGRTYLKGVFQKRKKAAALILMGFQKSGRPYLKGVFKKAACTGFTTLKGVKTRGFYLN